MEANPVLEIYNDSQDEIQTIFRSRLITQILIALGEGDKPLSELRTVTGSSSQAVIPKIRQLESMRYIKSSGDGYRLTITGSILAKEIEKIVRITGIPDSKRKFWCDHDISSIPEEFFDEIGSLHNSYMIFDDTANILNVHSNFRRILNEAECIYGISSIISPSHAEIMTTCVRHGIPVELIVTPDIIETMTTEEPYVSRMKALAGFYNFRLYVIPGQIKIGMSVTDKYLSLGLHSGKTGIYDSASDLISEDPRAIGWSRRLFDHYKSKSIQYDLERLL